MRRAPLPENLPFAFRTTTAIALGAAPGRLRAADLERPFAGVRTRGELPTLLLRCAALAERLTPAQFFALSTAPSLWGIPLPSYAHDGVIHAGVIPPAREPRLPGVLGHRLHLSSSELTLLDGLPLPHPAETWAQLGAQLCPHGCIRPHPVDDRPTARARSRMLHLDDLVIAADHLLHNELVDVDDLRGAVERIRRRGAVDLDAALQLARVGAESPKETETRLALVRGGLPEPELNWNLVVNGRFIARLDMANPRYRVAVEYDGRQHAEATQFARDADRWREVAAAGWTLIRIVAHHFNEPSRDIVQPVRAALTSRGWRFTG